jgi:hypothetical protein
MTASTAGGSVIVPTSAYSRTSSSIRTVALGVTLPSPPALLADFCIASALRSGSNTAATYSWPRSDDSLGLGGSLGLLRLILLFRLLHPLRIEKAPMQLITQIPTQRCRTAGSRGTSNVPCSLGRCGARLVQVESHPIDRLLELKILLLLRLEVAFCGARGREVGFEALDLGFEDGDLSRVLEKSAIDQSGEDALVS